MTKSDESDRLLSPQDLSEYLGIPVETIYGWRYRGVGPPAIKVGKHLRYRRSDVEAWIETAKAAPSKKKAPSTDGAPQCSTTGATSA